MGQIQPGKTEIVPVNLPPGFVSDMTLYAAGGRWWDGDGVRFRSGYPEKIGGWRRMSALSTTAGTPRTLFAWADLTAKARFAIGTTERVYAYDADDNGVTDITPAVSTTTLAANPLAAVSGSAIVTVSHPSHGMTGGKWRVILSGAVGFAGLSAGALTGEFEVVVVDANSYSIAAEGTATSTASGGGSAVKIEILVRLTSLATGWGAGAWGEGAWGQSPASSVTTVEPVLWSFDNWGEDLVVSYRGFGIAYYDVTTPNVRAAPLSTLAGASDVPEAAIQVLVDAELRFVLALGCSPIGASVRDSMFVRWSDRGNIANWSVGPASTAGGFRLSSGSRIVCGVKTRREILVFTDATLYTLQAVGGVSFFRPTVAAQVTTIAGPQAAIADQYDSVYWMGSSGFFRYNGRVEPLQCEVEDRVFGDINLGLSDRIVSGNNPEFNEVWWFYPSAGSTENDRYVLFNYAENSWATGQVVKRSAWLYSPLLEKPIAARSRGLFDHEVGYNNTDSGTAVSIPSFIYSAPTEVDDGNFVLQVDRVIPDLAFGSTSAAASPSVQFTITPADWPGSAAMAPESRNAVAGAKTGEVRPFTDRLDLRVRGRKFSLRVSNDQTGVFWRLGKTRVRVKMDGQR